jgi:chromosome partitioning protein
MTAGPGVLAVANQKGGVGKTTTAVNLAAALSRAGHRVLVVDLDSSCTATAVLLGPGAALERTVGDVLTGPDLSATSAPGERARQAVVASRWPGVDLLPSAASLVHHDEDGDAIQERLRGALDELEEYDWVLIDAPPHPGRLMGTAVLAADSVLLVTEPAAVSFYGLSRCRDTIDALASRYGHPVDIAGIVVNKVQTSTLPHRTALAALWEEHSSQVAALVPLRVPIAEAFNAGMSLYALADTSRGRSATRVAEHYEHLAARLTGSPTPPLALPFDPAEAAPEEPGAAAPPR